MQPLPSTCGDQPTVISPRSSAGGHVAFGGLEVVGGGISTLEASAAAGALIARRAASSVTAAVARIKNRAVPTSTAIPRGGSVGLRPLKSSRSTGATGAATAGTGCRCSDRTEVRCEAQVFPAGTRGIVAQDGERASTGPAVTAIATCTRTTATAAATDGTANPAREAAPADGQPEPMEHVWVELCVGALPPGATATALLARATGARLAAHEIDRVLGTSDEVESRRVRQVQRDAVSALTSAGAAPATATASPATTAVGRVRSGACVRTAVTATTTAAARPADRTGRADRPGDGVGRGILGEQRLGVGVRSRGRRPTTAAGAAAVVAVAE